MFLRSWAADPLRVAAVAPSGEALADIITREVDQRSGHVIELGPGTGVFTRKLLKRGVDPRDLTLIENGSEFAICLQARFPNARVLWMDAARLKGLDLENRAAVGAVVSGLPLLSMTPRQVMSILDGAFSHLRTDGAFYQFTYAARCPVPQPILDRLGLRATLVGRTFRNIPPASVYRISRRKAWRAAPQSA
ncbi:class I SAM-dependent methyltransferase [Terrarubrum flagellatum]|uniref:class I SAM-dependent methyltransferase n=1 Tax=Terrirubrum flagellatum TaxID=2895980 RepID=UPI003144DC42